MLSVHESRRRGPSDGGRAVLAARRRWARWFSCFWRRWPAAAQDQGLDPLLLAKRDVIASASDVEARGLQLFRLPFAFHVRSLDEHSWGLRVTFPVSFTSLRITGVSDLGSLVDSLASRQSFRASRSRFPWAAER